MRVQGVRIGGWQGDVLHGPERLVRLPIRFVCTIVYPAPSTPD